MSKNENQSVQEIFEALDFSAEDAEQKMREFIEAFNKIDVSPKAELLHRLNMSANGKDPGADTYNWRGVRGFHG